MREIEPHEDDRENELDEESIQAEIEAEHIGDEAWERLEEIKAQVRQDELA